jgi:hypothetical protein
MILIVAFVSFFQPSHASDCSKVSDRSKIVIEDISVEGEEDSVISFIWKRSSCKSKQSLNND